MSHADNSIRVCDVFDLHNMLETDVFYDEKDKRRDELVLFLASDSWDSQTNHAGSYASLYSGLFAATLAPLRACFRESFSISDDTDECVEALEKNVKNLSEIYQRIVFVSVKTPVRTYDHDGNHVGQQSWLFTRKFFGYGAHYDVALQSAITQVKYARARFLV